MPAIVGWVALQFDRGSASDAALTGTGDTLGVAQGWLPTGRTFLDRDVKYAKTGTTADTLIPTTCWGQVRTIRYGVQREYGGLLSSGGPRHSGRAQQNLLLLERNTDFITPHLLKHCANGFQIRRIVFVDNTAGLGDIVLVAENCYVVSCNAQATRYFKDTTRFNMQITGPKTNQKLTGTGDDEDNFLGATRAESVEILYTRMCYKMGSSGWQGWDSGCEKAWNDAPYTVEPPAVAPLTPTNP